MVFQPPSAKVFFTYSYSATPFINKKVSLKLSPPRFKPTPC